MPLPGMVSHLVLSVVYSYAMEMRRMYDMIDKNAVAVLFSYGLYVLYVLLPIVPAVLIYRWFPNTKVGVRGPIGTLTVRATGAFAAYVVTVVLGVFLVNNALQLIRQIPQPTWTLNATVELRDNQDKLINDIDLSKTLEVRVMPDVVVATGNLVRMEIPGGSGKKWPHPHVWFYVPGFRGTAFNLEKLCEKEDVDPYQLSVTIKDPVILKLAHDPDEEYPY
jgi:hypothetical protein